VVTTNGGYPLDQNLYQTVKGMSAAAQDRDRRGLIVTSGPLQRRLPAHGNFPQAAVRSRTPRAILDTVMAPGFSMFDQWRRSSWH